MNGIKVDIIKRKIFINKTFSKRMSNTSSVEYREYERVVSLNPTFEVVITTQKTYDRNKYKLGYDFIEAYIYYHEPDVVSRERVFNEYIEERWKALGHRCGRHEVCAWFLKKYPEFDNMYFESNPEPQRSKVEEFMERLGYYENGKLVEPTGIKLLTT